MNSTSDRSAKLTVASSIIASYPTVSNAKLHSVLSTLFGSSVRNTTLASLRKASRSPSPSPRR